MSIDPTRASSPSPSRPRVLGTALMAVATGWVAAPAAGRPTPPPFRAVQLERGIAPIADGFTPLGAWGLSTAHDGARVLVGAGSNFFQSPTSFSVGVAEIWEHTTEALGGAWQRVADLSPNEGLVNLDQFGGSVAIAGDIAIVGASGRKVGTANSAGAAYVFHRAANGTWSHAQTLTATTPAPGEKFATSLAIDGGFLVVGAPGRTGGGGAGLFALGGDGLFGPELPISISGSQSSDQWGFQVGIDAGTIVVSGPGAKVVSNGTTKNQAGTIATFVLQEGLPAFEAKLIAPAGELEAGAKFGTRIALSGGTLAVASPNWGGAEQGAVNCFKRAPNGWTEVGALHGQDDFEYFARLDADGDLLAVGSPLRMNGRSRGQTWLYRVGDTSLELLATRPATGDLFSYLGGCVSLPDGWWLAYESIDPYHLPALRGVRLGDPAGDCDEDGVANGVEVSSLGAADCDQDLTPDTCQLPANDCNGNGVLDACEVAAIPVESVTTPPIYTLLGSGAGANVEILLCRIDVPSSGVAALRAVGTESCGPEDEARVPCYVAVYADGDNDGLPDNLVLLEAWSTSFPMSPERFVVPVGPLPVEAGSVLFVAFGITDTTVADERVWVRTQTGPAEPGRTYFASWPAATLDFEQIGASASFVDLTSFPAFQLNVMCQAYFVPSIDADADGAIDTCTCPADLDRDGSVGPGDLATLLGAWGTAGGDLDGDGSTQAGDLAVLLGSWGPC